ncbi:MAG TPA: beta-ketoacyl-[acyl-carrier-protein] synthase family protein [Thermodesulfovibrionales bacterium]|jgi:3-oxoacyl-[acyl-carrier-protein] synthase II|nr:beta-ketoacyl-[acyl-carrier-protein] synthase family protein [Thermodesulfovibrionales bacterium]
MKKRRVVITGLGLATCLGLSVEENWQSVLKGESGIRKLDCPFSDSSPIQAAGAMREEDMEAIVREFREEGKTEGEKKTLIALWAAQQALRDAALPMEYGDRERYAVALASGIGINRLEDIARWINKDRTFDMIRFGKEFSEVHRESIMRNLSHRPSSLIAKKFGLLGMNATVTAACASATQAIGIGYRAIQRGEADVMAVGGSDTMTNPVGLIFFVLLNAASTSHEEPRTLCRPFDRRRSGLVMADGAAVAVLEEESHALQRGARIYAEVAGYGASLDAYQLTRPHPEGRGAVQSMRASLDDAGLGTDEIDYINAHGTSTKLNDVVETLAVKEVFGEKRAYRIPISSSKSMIGHTLAASGAPEFVFTVLSVQRDAIHPTINLSQPDPKCDLDYVPGVMRTQTVKAAISNSFGFGGQNASVVVKKYR